MSDEPRLTGHEYDGIAEYDNPLPGWWKATFVLSIVCAIVYAYWYHLGGRGTTIQTDFQREWQAYVAWKAAADKDAAITVDEQLLASWAHDPDQVARGRDIFVKNCVGCHMDDGRGNIGANLTDGFQIHGTTRVDLYDTIRDGVPDKGMVTWGATMAPRDMAAAAAYVSTLRNHPVAGGKDAQGAAVPAFE
jgi:cytochrome c oxidase cbb3-type subunit 3